jgi:hypothetical protein
LGQTTCGELGIAPKSSAMTGACRSVSAARNGLKPA